MSIFQEALLEPLARSFRFKKGINYVDKNNDLIVVDLGCGPKLRFLKYLFLNGFTVKKYIGIDPLVNNKFVLKFKRHKIINIINSPLYNRIEIKKESVDFIFAFAFFEHIDNPKEILNESFRILKPGGKIILTVPSKKAQTVLEFLSYKLKLISRREIEEHKQYFDHDSLIKILPKNSSKDKVIHKYFECGLNNLLVITK